MVIRKFKLCLWLTLYLCWSALLWWPSCPLVWSPRLYTISSCLLWPPLPPHSPCSLLSGHSGLLPAWTHQTLHITRALAFVLPTAWLLFPEMAAVLTLSLPSGLLSNPTFSLTALCKVTGSTFLKPKSGLGLSSKCPRAPYNPPITEFNTSYYASNGQFYLYAFSTNW